MIKVAGMHCSSCERLIEIELLEIDGVKKAKANAAIGVVEIEGDGFEPELIKKRISQLGYKVK